MKFAQPVINKFVVKIIERFESLSNSWIEYGLRNRIRLSHFQLTHYLLLTSCSFSLHLIHSSKGSCYVNKRRLKIPLMVLNVRTLPSKLLKNNYNAHTSNRKMESSSLAIKRLKMAHISIVERSFECTECFCSLKMHRIRSNEGRLVPRVSFRCCSFHMA